MQLWVERFKGLFWGVKKFSEERYHLYELAAEKLEKEFDILKLLKSLKSSKLVSDLVLSKE